MSQNSTIIKFENVSFTFGHDKHLLHEVSFSVRGGMKVALMGQNGAGKSTLFKLITKQLQPDAGIVSVATDLTVATAHQVIDQADKELTVEQYFHKVLPVEQHELRRRISSALAVVHLVAPIDKKISDLSGGQQARLLLAAALIQSPDLLLLDEPTNNLDYEGIYYLTDFLMNYKKSVIVISHDAEFLNAFTEGVLYLDSHTKVIEQYAGDYHDVLNEISARIEKENRENARLAKEIQENKEKANFFAHKGGKMRNVAAKMREKIEEYESEKVEVRKEDKTIRPFSIPAQADLVDFTLKISSFEVIQDHQRVTKESSIVLGKSTHLQIVGPNGMGKSTLIEALATGTAPGVSLTPGVTIGYYRQDFSTLNFSHTVHQSLVEAVENASSYSTEEELRSVASGFLITKELMRTTVGALSEGQKGLLSFARLVLMKPGLLILDEPTNHINFRHLPNIAAALNQYEGAMILVSHVADFVAQIRIDRVLDLEK
ncbi:MAG: ATP-binding cassette domain-containing protein [bacterium]|nr:ATP-binding cassette domain-containing protein [bacterium]